MHWEQYWRTLVMKKKGGLTASILRALLLPLSWCFQLGVFLRSWAYQSGFFRLYDPPVFKVISIGNIAVGGTGKTPFTHLLASELLPFQTIAILYRGYRSKAETLSTPLTLCRGKGPMFPAHYCGDEPYMLATKLPQTHIFVGKNRIAAARLAAESGAEIILLDDGMQHRGLVRDTEVVILDSEDPFGQGYFLPRGLLREGKQALSRADLLVLHPIQNAEQFEPIKQKMQTVVRCPIIGTNLRVNAVRTLEGDDVGSLVGRSVGIFCAIAQPERFRKTVQDLGARIVSEKFINDHEKMETRDLELLAQKTVELGGEALLCTEKDRVKLPENPSLACPIFWVDVQLVVTSGEEEWQEFLRSVRPG